MDERTRKALISPEAADRFADLAVIDTTRSLTDFGDSSVADLLARVEVLVTSWGVPRLDEKALDRMPRLRAVLHAAGSVKRFVDPAVFERGITVTSAADANAVPVAEFTLAAIIFATKRVGRFAHALAAQRNLGAWELPVVDVGTFGRTIAIVGASRIGRRVMDLLRNLDVTVLLVDPTLTPKDAEAVGAELVDIDTACRRADVISLHAPDLPSTRHLLNRDRLALLRDGATVVNTARGALIDTLALTEEVVAGRLDAILDVTEPEPLPEDSPLFEAPNALLTPHIAGALGTELARLVHAALDELEEFAAGREASYPVRLTELDTSA